MRPQSLSFLFDFFAACCVQVPHPIGITLEKLRRPQNYNFWKIIKKYNFRGSRCRHFWFFLFCNEKDCPQSSIIAINQQQLRILSVLN
ncbi:hypothetical protein ACLKA6_013745 [Drosophila palustris]